MCPGKVKPEDVGGPGPPYYHALRSAGLDVALDGIGTLALYYFDAEYLLYIRRRALAHVENQPYVTLDSDM